MTDETYPTLSEDHAKSLYLTTLAALAITVANATGGTWEEINQQRDTLWRLMDRMAGALVLWGLEDPRG